MLKNQKKKITGHFLTDDKSRNLFSWRMFLIYTIELKFYRNVLKFIKRCLRMSGYTTARSLALYGEPAKNKNYKIWGFVFRINTGPRKLQHRQVAPMSNFEHFFRCGKGDFIKEIFFFLQQYPLPEMSIIADNFIKPELYSVAEKSKIVI